MIVYKKGMGKATFGERTEISKKEEKDKKE